VICKICAELFGYSREVAMFDGAVERVLVEARLCLRTSCLRLMYTRVLGG
jgi:hypothetical protein